MPFSQTYSTTYTRSGESFTSAVTLTGTGEINLDGTTTALGSKTFDVDYLPSKLLGIIIKCSGSCTLQAKKTDGTNLGSALSVTASTTVVLGVSATQGVYYYYSGSNTGLIPLCDNANLTTPVASIVATDTGNAANTVNIRILYDAAP
jgi:hypothetical protein